MAVQFPTQRVPHWPPDMVTNHLAVRFFYGVSLASLCHGSTHCTPRAFPQPCVHPSLQSYLTPPPHSLKARRRTKFLGGRRMAFSCGLECGRWPGTCTESAQKIRSLHCLHGFSRAEIFSLLSKIMFYSWTKSSRRVCWNLGARW